MQVDILDLLKPESKNMRRKKKRHAVPKVGYANEVLNMLNEVKQKGGLCPVMPAASEETVIDQGIDVSQWEELYAIMDSGATVPVLNPRMGKAYRVEESAASRANVEYEIADGSALPNLGQKRMAVLTNEGTLRGYSSQCADVSKALQSVRSMVASGHAVCFGLGEQGDQHVIINKHSGEVNHMLDDGVNYLQRLMVIPQNQINAVQGKLSEMHQQWAADHEQSFARPGR